MFKDHDNRVFARKRSYIDKWKPSISEIHVKTKNTNIFVSWFTFLPMGDVDTHAPTRLSFQHAFNRDTCNFSGGLMQLLSSTFLFFWKDLMTPSVEISKYCLHSCKIMSYGQSHTLFGSRFVISVFLSLSLSLTLADIFPFFAIRRYRTMYKVNLSKAQHTFYNTI